MGGSGPARLGLSMSHISPRPCPAFPFAGCREPAPRPLEAVEPAGADEPAAFSVEVAAGGTFVRLRGPGSGPPSGGGIRGDISGFSRASRKRLLDRLNQVPVELLSAALFLTLTFPDEFPALPEGKRCLDIFLKRLRRAHPECSGVWRMERVPRLSGVHAGELAPHFHVLLFGVPWLSVDWLSRSWYESVGSGDERHLRAGTSAQRVRSRRAALAYCGKYLGKVAQVSDGAWTGRHWAVFGDAWLNVLIRTYELTRSQFYRLRRVCRAWVLRGWRGGRAVRGRWARAAGQGCTAYLSEAAAVRLLAWVADG